MTAKLKNSFSRFDIFAALCFLAALAFLLWKAPYGFSQADENFYLSTPYRLVLGDALLAHEWNSSQLFSFLSYPSLKFLIYINGSSSGIFLSFRYFFVAAQLLCAVYLYISLRHVQTVGALIGALLMLLYAPLHIMSLSYNTICLLLLPAACVTMLRFHKARASAFISGLLFAGAVICCPYLVALYLLYTLLCIIAPLKKHLEYSAFSPSYWLLFTVACAVLAAIFLAFILSRASLQDCVAALPKIFTDSESLNSTFFFQLFKYAESIYGNFWFNSYSLSWPILALVLALDKNRLKHRVWYLIPAMLITAGYFAYYIFEDRTVNYLMFPMNILGFFACFLCKKRDMRPFVLIYVPGIIYSLCIHFASNLALMSIASAMTVSGIASAIYICTLAKELITEDKRFLPQLVGLGLLLAMLMQLSVLVWFRSRYTMWDGDTSELSVTLSEGPQKGIITTQEKADRYYRLIEDTAAMRQAPAQTVLYLYTDTWLYLMDDSQMGSFSSWVSYLYPKEDMARLESYWQLYPEKVPDIIFCGDKGDKLALLTDILPGVWTQEETDSGVILRR